jgi:hypothetical protein
MASMRRLRGTELGGGAAGFGGGADKARVMHEEGNDRWGPPISRAQRGAPLTHGPIRLMERGGGPGRSGPAQEV